jgi:hypothetical protein
MLLKIAGYLLLLPPILGFGSVIFSWIGRKIAIPRDFANIAFIGVAGFAILGIIVNLLNFFVPIAPPIPLITMIVGWILFVVNRRQLRAAILPEGTSWRVRLGIVFAVMILFCAYYTQRGFLPGDTGWYHFPSLKWIAENPLAAGIANLNSRFGYNFGWFPIATMMEVVPTAHESAYIINGLLLLFFSVVVWEAITRTHDKTIKLSQLFLILCSLSWAVMIFFSPKEIPSFTPNFPIAIVALLATYAMLCALESQEHWQYYLMVVIFLALFGIVIKFSAGMLILAIPIVFLYQSRALHLSRDAIASVIRKVVIVFVPIVILMYVPWMIRGVMLSGCLAYPVPQSCIHSLPWTVTDKVAQAEVVGITAWSRLRFVGTEVTLGSWDWIPGWWDDTISQPRVMVLLIPLVLGILGWAALLIGKRRQAFDGQTIFFLATIPPIAACILWFFVGPDFKYIYGSFGSLTQLILASAVWGLINSRLDLSPKFWRWQAQLARIVIIGLSIWILAKTGEAVLKRNREILLELPEQGELLTQVMQSKNGEAIYWADGQYCWNTPLPCADHILPSTVVVTRDSQNYIRSIVLNPTQ